MSETNDRQPDWWITPLRILIWPVLIAGVLAAFHTPISELLDQSFTAKGAGVEVSIEANSDSREVLDLLLTQVEATDSSPVKEDPKIEYLSELHDRYLVYVSDLSSQSPSNLNERYKESFRAMINKNYEVATYLIDYLYARYPTHYNIHEIRILLRENKPSSDSDWNTIYGKIIKDYSWKAPEVELVEMESMIEKN